METPTISFDSLPVAVFNLREEIRELKALLLAKAATPQVTSPLDDFTPIDEIFKRGIMSKPTFYQRVKDGRIVIFKMGSRSFIRTADYQNLFRKAEVATTNKKA